MLGKEQFRYHLALLLPDFRQERFLLAVSGGADSMVMLSLFNTLDVPFEVAHVNYKLRGADSDGDQELVKTFCKKRNIPLHCYEVSEKDQRPEGSIQLWARELRYTFFNQIKKRRQLPFLVTAHHLNDQIETFIINMARGSGLRGLSGIPPNRNHILRPLLGYTKQEIYEYAKAENVPFREDYTNFKDDYLRNRIRNRIVPELVQTNPNFLTHFDQSIGYIRDASAFITISADQILKNISTEKDGKIILDRTQLKNQNPILQFEILSRYGYSHTEEIGKLFTATTGSQFFTTQNRITVNRNELIIENRPIDAANDEEKIIAMNLDDLKRQNFKIHIPDLFERDSKKEVFWTFDINKIRFPLKIRHKKEGDFFFPTGMTGRKKISKFFKDEKISILAKSKIWLLCDGDDTPLGIIPLRQDRRFAGLPGSSDTLKIDFT